MSVAPAGQPTPLHRLRGAGAGREGVLEQGQGGAVGGDSCAGSRCRLHVHLDGWGG